MQCVTKAARFQDTQVPCLVKSTIPCVSEKRQVGIKCGGFRGFGRRLPFCHVVWGVDCHFVMKGSVIMIAVDVLGGSYDSGVATGGQMPKSKLSKEDWEVVRGDYESGLPHLELAAAWDISVHTLRSYAKRSKWSRNLQQLAKDKLDNIKYRARARVDEAIEEATGTMQAVLDDHKKVSLDLTRMLEDTIEQIKVTEFDSIGKRLFALKTASDVSTTLMKHQRKTWNMDDQQKGTMLEELLDDIEDEAKVRTKAGIKVVGND